MPRHGSNIVSIIGGPTSSAKEKRDAFTRLAEEHQAKLRRFLAGSISNRDDAEDIVQEVFCRALKDERLLSMEAPEAYLYKMARNILIDRYRQNKLRSAIDQNRIAQRAGTAGNKADLNYNEMTVAYQEALALLPPKCRQVFLMRSYDGLTNSEIAEHLGVSMRMVQKQLAKAMKHFHKELYRQA